MGVIQSSINSGMATLAAGIAAGKKIGTDVKKDKLEMDSLKADKTKELADVEGKINITQDAINTNEALKEAAEQGINIDTAKYDPVTKTYKGKKERRKEYVAHNVEKQQRSIDVLNRDLKGLMMQRDALNKFLDVGKKGGKK